MSLYTWICKYFKYPVGHPKIHLECNDIPTTRAKELVRCTMLPPRTCIIRCCHTGATVACYSALQVVLGIGSQERCIHETVSERALTATWFVDKFRVAVDRGYRVIKIHEFYEYEVTQYDPKTGEGHFVQYIYIFLKFKAEASDYPRWVQGPKDQDRYVQCFRESEGIELDKTTIQKNAAKRGLAKLCLNSFWGKLTESNNRPKSKIIADPQELFRFLATPGIKVIKLLLAAD